MTDPLLRAEFTNADRIRAGLRVAPKAMRSELRKSHSRTAKEGQRWIRDAATAGTPQQRHMAAGIKGVGNSTQALIRTVPGGKGSKTAGAQGAYYGAKKFKQFPAWVGPSWKPAVRGQGPQPHNDVLAEKRKDIDTIFIKGQDDAIARAVPRF